MRIQRHAGAAGVLLVLAVVAAGCSSPHKPGAVTSSPATSSATASSPVWQPPFYGSAKPAVDALTALLSAYSSAIRSPNTSSKAVFEKYAIAQAKQAFDGAFTAARKAGIEFRGTPPQPRIVVTSSSTSTSLPEVVMENCPLNSPADPFTGYYVKTGKPAPAPSGGPWPQTAKAFYLTKRWVIVSFSTDQSKTCAR